MTNRNHPRYIGRLLLSAALAGTLLLTGCVARGGAEVAAAEIDPASAAQTILDEVTFRDTLVEATDGAAENYYSLTDAVSAYSIHISGSGATAEEVAVLKVGDAADRAAAEEIVEKRVESLKTRFQDYVPEEMTKLNDPVIVSKGDVVILVLADDSAAAKKVVDSLF